MIIINKENMVDAVFIKEVDLGGLAHLFNAIAVASPSTLEKLKEKFVTRQAPKPLITDDITMYEIMTTGSFERHPNGEMTIGEIFVVTPYTKDKPNKRKKETLNKY